MVATPKLHTCEVVRIGSGALIRLGGTIDETFQASEFPPEVREMVAIDLNDVQRISSFGVREWLNAVTSLKTQYTGFIRARPMMVAQFNMVSGFEGRGQLLSLYMPFVCPSCSNSFEVLVDLRTQPAHSLVESPPTPPCPKCKEAAEFDDLPESYFEFALGQAIPHPPPGFDDLAQGKEDPRSKPVGRSKVRKEVIGPVTLVTVEGKLVGKSLKRALDGVDGQLVMNFRSAHIPAEAFAELTGLLSAVAYDVVIAGAPISLAAESAKWPRASWQSALVRATCLSHGPQEVLVVGADGVAHCSTCPAVLALDADVTKALASLRWVPEAAKFNEILRPRSGAEATPLDIGRYDATLAGKYHVVRRIAFGGMAEVLLAKQVSVGGFEKLVVLKRILPQHAANPEFLNLFLREARLSARIVHPNVVQVLDVLEQGSEFFMVLEFIDGYSLRHLARQAALHRQQLSIGIVIRMLADLANALSAAHEHRDDSGALNPIAHRDLSTDNIMISKKGHIKLTDFGLAKSASSLSMTPSTNVRGKLAYLAPELLTERTPSTAALLQADIYAVGVIGYALLTGVQPFRRETEAQTLFAVIEGKMLDPRTIRPEVPDSLAELVMSAMSRAPEKRPESARAFADRLHHIMNYENIGISPEHMIEEMVALNAPIKIGAAEPGLKEADLFDEEVTPAEADVEVVIVESELDDR